MQQDNEGRRSRTDRRTYTYTEYFPERRAGYDRRTEIDKLEKSRQ